MTHTQDQINAMPDAELTRAIAERMGIDEPYPTKDNQGIYDGDVEYLKFDPFTDAGDLQAVKDHAAKEFGSYAVWVQSKSVSCNIWVGDRFHFANEVAAHDGTPAGRLAAEARASIRALMKAEVGK